MPLIQRSQIQGHKKAYILVERKVQQTKSKVKKGGLQFLLVCNYQTAI